MSTGNCGLFIYVYSRNNNTYHAEFLYVTYAIIKLCNYFLHDCTCTFLIKLAFNKGKKARVEITIVQMKVLIPETEFRNGVERENPKNST